ncbi:MAG: hypothetical protein L6R41_008383 [Letrouitia leprolyta]|nr:MAG: hypothetical protein L6R41_008383 [Letrouitia leprolyta]
MDEKLGDDIVPSRFSIGGFSQFSFGSFDLSDKDEDHTNSLSDRHHDDSNLSKPYDTTSKGEDEYPGGWRLAAIMTSLCLGTLLVAIDNTIIGIAIPQISTVFDALADVGWYGSAYLLTVTALQPTFGNVYKYFDVKITYLVSILVFEVGSILCAAAPDSPTFIVGRAVAGAGSAGIFQGALVIVGYITPLEKRPLYLGIVVSSFGIATCFGPILGGVLTQEATWRWCFWINLPIGGLVLIILLVALKINTANTESRSLPFKTKMMNMDFIGAALLVGAVCCLLLALQWGGNTMPWNSATVIGLFVGFGIISVIFAVLQWFLGDKGTISPRILRKRSVLMGCLFEFFLSMTLYIFSYYIPFYFQAVQSVSATTSGVRYIAFAIPEVVAVITSGAIVSRIGHYVRLDSDVVSRGRPGPRLMILQVPFMILCTIVTSVGSGCSTLLSVDTSTVQWAAYLVITGFGIGLGVQLPYTALQVILE